jgi:hypothetical protein
VKDLLNCTVTRHVDRVRVYLAGELDGCSARQLDVVRAQDRLAVE